ncbi:MAG: alpha-galactosidase [Alkalispirochaeta sp.]
MITTAPDGRTFHLHNRFFSYVIHVMDGRFPAHTYWGAPLGPEAPIDAEALMQPAAAPYLAIQSRGSAPSDGEWQLAVGGYSLDTLPQEYPTWGTGEQRRGALEAVLSDGTEALRLEYRDHQVVDEPLFPEALPALRSDHRLGAGGTLRVQLADPRGDLAVELYYVVLEESGALFRWTRVTNSGAQGPVTVRRAVSASWDLPTDHYDMVSLGGAWARERHVLRTGLTAGSHAVGTRAGASSHQTSPFVAACHPETDEHHGQVWAAGLLYSGNFSAGCDVDQYGACRVSVGIDGYRGYLQPGEAFDTPVAALVYSTDGFTGMSAAFHHLLRDGLVGSRWRAEPRKTVINSWEAMYFDLSAERVVDLARAGRDIGAELLVLDDGWFSQRRDDTTSLGDWWVNRELFPDGLAPVAEQVRAEGLEFGLWMEPEMVSPESRLFRDRPEWFLQVPGRDPTPARNQLTLDLSNPAVVDHLFETIAGVLRVSTATYIKWDMNRTMSEAGSPALPAERQGEVMHRYMLGLYRLLERLTTEFPEVLFEGCAGGGGRFDMGLARYSPRFWTSDQTDAVERLDVQYGSTLVFPPEMIGAHVSSVPNHIVGRTTPAWTRVVTAAAFSYGYELNPPRETEEDREVFRRGSELYQLIRRITCTGRFVRLGSASGSGGAGAPAARSGIHAGRAALSGETGGERAWMVEAADGSEVVVFHVRPLARTNWDGGYLRLSGLDAGPTGARVPASGGPAPHGGGEPAASGEPVRGASGATMSAGVQSPATVVYRDVATGRRYSAAQLIHRGLPLGIPTGDYQAQVWHLVREDTQ